MRKYLRGAIEFALVFLMLFAVLAIGARGADKPTAKVEKPAVSVPNPVVPEAEASPTFSGGNKVNKIDTPKFNMPVAGFAVGAVVSIILTIVSIALTASIVVVLSVLAFNFVRRGKATVKAKAASVLDDNLFVHILDNAKKHLATRRKVLRSELDAIEKRLGVSTPKKKKATNAKS